MQMSNAERKNYLYLYDLPKGETTSNQIAMIIMDKTGYKLDRKPQIRRDINRPFNTAIVIIADNECFQKACVALRYFDIAGKMCRALPYDSELQGTNQARLVEHNVFITKIPKDDQHNCEWLEKEFRKYGEIKSLKISLNPDHKSRGYGFACFQEPASAAACLQENASKDETKVLKYQPRDKRDFRRVFNNIYAKNLPDDYDEEKTKQLFSRFGPIGMLKFGENDIGKYAMIAFFSEDKEDRESGPKAAALAVEELNGKDLDGKKLYVKQFLKKTEREQERKKETMKYKNSKKRCNLYVKNIPEDSTEDSIKELFGQFGEIESVKLFPKDGQEQDGQKGRPKNFFCFVCFKKPDAASTAKEKLHNQQLVQGRPPLSINHYEIKEIRELQNEESHDKLGFREFRQNYAEKQWSETVNQEDVLLCLSRIFQQLPPHLWQQRAAGGPRQQQLGGQPNMQQNQPQRGNYQGGNKGPYQSRSQDQRPNQGGVRAQGMPLGQQLKPTGPMGQPIHHMQQMQGPQMMMGGGFPQQQQQQPQQPGSIQEAYLHKTLPILKGVTAENPYYKQQVGTAIYDFVNQLKGDKAPKITGMLIDLNIQEIQLILQSYDLLRMRVDQADQLLSQQMANAQQ